MRSLTDSARTDRRKIDRSQAKDFVPSDDGRCVAIVKVALSLVLNETPIHY